MADIFITSTLKNSWNLEFAPRLCTALEDKGFSVHLPQRDTNQTGSSTEKCHDNYAAVRSCKVLLGVLVNATINSGCEFGVAHGIGKPIVFLTDTSTPVPVMALCMPAKVFCYGDVNDIDSYIEDLVALLRLLCEKR